MKRIVTVQDISCFGKCSLTVALPVISAMGIETAVIPTAVLSTHTGDGFSGFTFRDLTSDISGIAQHWSRLGLGFDSIYTGYLGSIEQLGIVSGLFDSFGGGDCFIVVDPVMGDSGKMYAGFTDEFTAGMRQLCSRADYIIPNLTEAALLLDRPYSTQQTEESVKKTLRELAELGCRTPVLTGVCLDGENQGAAAFDSASGEYCFSFRRQINRQVHGTGDIFASVFTGAVTLGMGLAQAVDTAVGFTHDCIEATLPQMDRYWYGSCFELCLGELTALAEEYGKNL
ncbi:MAG: pyridoxamine kinase [Ruminococcus sp.]|nr:pyridoxamine kinase [Ruminococcus sp.]